MNNNNIQALLELVYNKNQQTSIIMKELESDSELMVKVNSLPKEDQEFTLRAMMNLMLHRRLDVSTLMGMSLPFTNDKDNVGSKLLKLAEEDFIDYDPTKEVFITKYSLDKDTMDSLDRFQYPLPLIVKPLKVKANNQNGYFKQQGSILLNTYHTDDVCLDHLNRVNSIPYSINWTVAETAQLHAENEDTPKPGESLSQFKKRIEQFNCFRNSMLRAMDTISGYGNQLYFTHAYDKRGRTYCNGYYLNTQGMEYQKSVLELFHKEKVTADGLKYLEADLVNSYGEDKLSIEDRVEYFKVNPNLTSDKPMFIAAANAYKDATEDKSIGYMIELDATASGCQIMSILTGDTSAAKLCNVINDGGRKDVYTEIFSKMKETLHDDKTSLERKQVKKAIMTSLYGSDLEPKSIFGDGSELYNTFLLTMSSCMPEVWSLNEILKHSWNPNWKEYGWVLPDNFHVEIPVMKQVKSKLGFNGGVYMVTHYENECVDKSKELCPNIIHSIDGFINREMVRMAMFSPERNNHLLRLCLENQEFNPNSMCEKLWDLYEDTGYLSYRILDYIKTAADIKYPELIADLIEDLPMKPFELVSIHDCFKCHPNYGKDVRDNYRKILTKLAKSNILNSITKTLFGIELVTKNTKEFIDAVSKEEHALS